MVVSVPAIEVIEGEVDDVVAGADDADAEDATAGGEEEVEDDGGGGGDDEVVVAAAITAMAAAARAAVCIPPLPEDAAVRGNMCG